MSSILCLLIGAGPYIFTLTTKIAKLAANQPQEICGFYNMIPLMKIGWNDLKKTSTTTI
jgi:hypothetical protein